MKMKASSKSATTEISAISHEAYEENLHLLQIELVKLQKHFISCSDRILVILKAGTPLGRTAPSSALSNISARVKPASSRLGSLLTVTEAHGTSGAIRPNSRPPASSRFSIGVGTTGRA